MTSGGNDKAFVTGEDTMVMGLMHWRLKQVSIKNAGLDGWPQYSIHVRKVGKEVLGTIVPQNNKVNISI